MFRQHPMQQFHDLEVEVEVTDDAAPNVARRHARTGQRSRGAGWSAMVAAATVAVGVLAVQLVGTGGDPRRGDATAAAPQPEEHSDGARAPLPSRTLRIVGAEPDVVERAADTGCTTARGGTADTLERLARACAEETRSAIVRHQRTEACLQRLPATPDSLERWVDPCRERAEREIADRRRYETCMASVARTPDVAERWVQRCR